MYYIYFDESKFPKKNFIIGSFVFCKEDPTNFIEKSLAINGFDPLIYEYKSSTHFGRTPQMAEVRKALKYYFMKNCFFGILVLPHSEIKNLGSLALMALKEFLEINNQPQKNTIYFDEGIFLNKEMATTLINTLNLYNNSFHLEQDSKKIRGIQLADLCAHSLTTILRESMGDLKKIVKVSLGSTDALDGESEIGFDIWASIRYNFIHEPTKKYDKEADQETNFTFNVEPYGLYIAQECDIYLASKARETFGKVYLGCIH
ncbi:MAG: DUF3800 domain-containing protein [Bacteroidetes bacterium]|nr:DUF3800 domain-containing protein [Bacteroidota bacterium]